MISPVTMSASGSSIILGGIPGEPPFQLLERLLPDLLSTERVDAKHAVLHCSRKLGKMDGVQIRVRSRASWSDVAYGALRFWHAASHALQGRVVADAGLVERDGQGLLLIGSGKSHYSILCSNVSNVLSDDTVILESIDGAIVGTGSGSTVVESRTGERIRIAAVGRSVPIRGIVFVEGSYGADHLREPAPADALSWLLTATLGKVLNTRARPASFREHFPGSAIAACRVSDIVSAWDLPARHALGTVSAQRLWEWVR